MKIVFLSIGTNLGNRERNLAEAISGIKEHIGQVLEYSSVYETEPWGFESENTFLNMVVKVKTKLNPRGLLGRILMVENLAGRVRGEDKYISRLIDIDILLFEDKIVNEDLLKIPHPLLAERMFVLVPLCEIAEEVLHPVMQIPFRLLLESCMDKSRVIEYKQQNKLNHDSS